ncbi:uncharacterized protein K460DRAFT_16749 [Cucurbitaria berberidis CBS 394.84]|uniref:Uncharacterized protein n=1 Tax=Cucurbitaria berberidis CBS 394.84 TaxID=1168544 RepID=A0A9P4GSF3_9PLEO|nr:uncharacterized protein K460DRAFT_16749 [Cucurbitaria berberidis CBS 394.84]KAF1850495.1 hypothetical protein K460DRAFT_16749 [Cucurbitaria berberidis CBS 394.84]
MVQPERPSSAKAMPKRSLTSLMEQHPSGMVPGRLWPYPLHTPEGGLYELRSNWNVGSIRSKRSTTGGVRTGWWLLSLIDGWWLLSLIDGGSNTNKSGRTRTSQVEHEQFRSNTNKSGLQRCWLLVFRMSRVLVFRISSWLLVFGGQGCFRGCWVELEVTGRWLCAGSVNGLDHRQITSLQPLGHLSTLLLLLLQLVMKFHLYPLFPSLSSFV